MTRDLTRGSPLRLILGFGIPVLLGALFQQFYNLVDTAIVGKVLGGAALAAVGSTGSINFLVVGFCTGVCSGFSIPVSRQFGAGDEQGVRRYMTGGVWLTALLTVLLTTVTVLFCRQILLVMDTPADILERAVRYIGTIFAGLPAYFLYNYCASVLRSLGDSRTPVICLVVASLINIGLDFLFIQSFHLDVFGAALATVLAQAMAGAACLIRMCRDFPILRTRREDWTWNRERAGELCIMGLPMGLQFSITAIGSILIQTAVNGLGTLYVTAVTAASRISIFLSCPSDAMGSTMATYGGQNVGARKWDRLHQGVKACTLLGIAWAVIALVLVLLFADPLNMLFLDEESRSLLPLARQYLLTLASFYVFLALVNILRLMIQGMGFSPLATFAGVLEMVGRGAVSCLVPRFGFAAACFASPAAWILADAFLIPAYLYCHRRLSCPDDSRRHRRRRAAAVRLRQARKHLPSHSA